MEELARLLKVEQDYFPDVDDGWQAGSDFLLLIANHILTERPVNVVECGSGLSTVVIARCLQLINDHTANKHPKLISLEHEEDYYQRTFWWLKERGLGNYAEVKRFDLRGEPPFYAYNFQVPSVDLIVVDGPPTSTHPMARYGAKSLFRYLSPGASVYLDDLRRPGEILVRDIWRWELADQGFDFQDIDVERGACHIKRKQTDRQSVLVSVPNTGWISRDLFQPLWMIGNDHRYSVTFNMPCRKPVEVAYCEMAEMLREGDYDWWLNIDSDNPPTRNPLDLIELDKDIITCPTPIWRPDNEDKPFSWNAMFLGEDGTHYEWQQPSGLQEVDAVGMGCTLINKRVFQVPKMQYQPFMREWKPNGTALRGTDVSFCMRAKESGFKVWAHFDYPCDHMKEVNLTKALKLMARFANQGYEDARRAFESRGELVPGS